jgi:membrane-bound serine protease (ClpP class)
VILGAILLLLAAAALIAAELFLPSHGVLGIAAALCAVASIIMAARVSPLLGALFGFTILLVTPFVIYWAIKLYPKSPIGKRVMLDAPAAVPTDKNHDPSARLQQLVGQQGIAMTMLRPAGSVELNGQRINCVSESEVIDAGTKVEVIRVSGIKVIVKPVANSRPA